MKKKVYIYAAISGGSIQEGTRSKRRVRPGLKNYKADQTKQSFPLRPPEEGPISRSATGNEPAL